MSWRCARSTPTGRRPGRSGRPEVRGHLASDGAAPAAGPAASPARHRGAGGRQWLRRVALRRLGADGTPGSSVIVLPLRTWGTTRCCCPTARCSSDRGGHARTIAALRLPRVRPDGTVGRRGVVADRRAWSRLRDPHGPRTGRRGGALLTYNAPAASGLARSSCSDWTAAAVAGARGPAHLKRGRRARADGRRALAGAGVRAPRGEYLLVYDDRQASILRPRAVGAAARRRGGSGGRARGGLGVPTLLDGDSAGPLVVPTRPPGGSWRGWSAARPGRRGLDRLMARRLRSTISVRAARRCSRRSASRPGAGGGRAGRAGVCGRTRARRRAGRAAARQRAGPRRRGDRPRAGGRDARPAAQQLPRRGPTRVWSAGSTAGRGRLRLRGLPDGVHRVAVRSVGPEGWVELGGGAEAVLAGRSRASGVDAHRVPVGAARRARFA